MSAKENSDTNKDMGGVYPVRAGDVRNDYDPITAPVYAGPILNSTHIPPEMMMMVYAGPDVMNGNNTKKTNTLREYVNPETCRVCGAQNQKGAKFCIDCGSVLED